MHFLVTIDLSAADLAAFDHYEAQVVPLLAQYGAEMEVRVRSLDRQSETHLLHFPDDAAHRAFLADPTRQAMRPILERSGATSTVIEVEQL
jgi:uncharacterized protein (DUF1330 family)